MAQNEHTRVSTRSKNAHQHPGDILLEGKRTRRSAAEVAEEKMRKHLARMERQKEKHDEMERRKEGAKRVAELEDKMAVDDVQRGSAHPRYLAGKFRMLFHKFDI